MFFVSPLTKQEANSIVQEEREIEIGELPDPNDYTPHDNVYIDDDGDFPGEGFTGDGSSGNPYVLEGMIIQRIASGPKK